MNKLDEKSSGTVSNKERIFHSETGDAYSIKSGRTQNKRTKRCCRADEKPFLQTYCMLREILIG